MRSASLGCEDRPLDGRDRELPCRVAADQAGERLQLARWLRPVCAENGHLLPGDHPAEQPHTPQRTAVSMWDPMVGE